MKKTLVITLALIATMTVSSIAQPRTQRTDREQQPATPEMMAERMTERVASQLNLDEKQKNELYKINLDKAKKQRKDADKRQKEVQKRAKKSVKEMDRYDAKLRKILTDAQYLELKTNHEKQRGQMMERRNGMKEKRGDRPDGRNGDKMGSRDGKPGGERKHDARVGRPRNGGERGNVERRPSANGQSRESRHN